LTDRLGYRLRVGIVVPSFNTTVQPELEALRPPGVTNHVARIDMPDGDLTSDRAQEAVLESLGPDMEASLRRVMGARPGIVIFGIAIPTFWNGLDGMTLMREHLQATTGVPVVLGSDAVLEALRAFPRARRIGVVTPYQPVANRRVQAFLEEAGYDVVAVRSLTPQRSSLIAELGVEQFSAAIDSLAAKGADVLVQVGTNLAIADLVDAQSLRVGLQILSINTALYWLALRRAGITDRVAGFGPPLDRA
jgi:maleate isomerase